MVDASGQLTVQNALDPAAGPLSVPQLISDLSATGNNQGWNANALISNQGQTSSNPLTKVSVTVLSQLDASVVDLDAGNSCVALCNGQG